jgi:hypothetical protein
MLNMPAQSRSRRMCWWTSAPYPTDVFAFTDIYDRFKLDGWQYSLDAAAYAATLARPSQRVIPNNSRWRMTDNWLRVTRSNMSANVNQPLWGAKPTSASGSYQVQWDWYDWQGIAANNCVIAVQWLQPNFPAANATLLELFTDANNRVSLYFKDAGTGHLWMRAIAGGVTIGPVDLGLVSCSDVHIVALKITPAGIRGSLDQGTVQTAAGAVPTGTILQAFFDYNNANGIRTGGTVDAICRHIDVWHADDVADDAALTTLIFKEGEMNPVAFWDGTGAAPAQIVYGQVGTPATLTAPSGVADNGCSRTVVKLNFTNHPVSGVGDHVDYFQTSLVSGGPYSGMQVITSGGASVTSLTPLAGAGNIYLRMRSTNDQGFGAWSSEVVIAVP